MSEVTQTSLEKKGNAFGKVALFAVVAILWLLFDQLTKAYFDDFAVGEIVVGPYLGLIQFTLVHNTGAAWGMFGDMTMALGIVSLLICVLILVYLFFMRSSLTPLGSVALGLIFAGGMGNVIDRFTNGYVIDFIAPIFIDFPVFNIADIGVTCGVVLFIIDLIIEGIGSRSARSDESADAADPAEEGH